MQKESSMMNKSSIHKSSLTKQSQPLKNIKTIQQSLNILKNKISQMNKRQSQNVKQIQKVFYSSIPNLKQKLSQSIEAQKIQQRKKILYNQSVIKQRNRQNRQKKMINQKQIQRNRQLITIMKINQHNSIKQLSKKNQLLIQKMKTYQIQQNIKKKMIVQNHLNNSRLNIQNFKSFKLQEIKKQKEQDTIKMKKKLNKMNSQLFNLSNKQNQTIQKVDKSQQALKQLKFAIDRLSKMNQNQFIKLKNKILIQQPYLSEQKVIQKMLLQIIQNSKISFSTVKANKTPHGSRWSSQHLSKNC